MKRLFATLLLLTLVASTAAAQEAPRPPRAPRAPEAPRQPAQPRVLPPELLSPYDGNARETQRRLNDLFRQYPPSLFEVLRLDPSLLTNQAYLEPYPALAAFLAQHPEISHNPGFFLGGFRVDRFDNSWQGQVGASLRDIMFFFNFLTGFLAVVFTIGWLIRTLIEHRRWLRLSKVQTEAHSKLLDRLTSNEDVLAYIQSSPGRKFLESAPITADMGPRSLGSPIGRILWTVQAGLIVCFGGAGLLYVSSRVAGHATAGVMELPLFAVGTLVTTVGAGFVFSAAVAYMLSRRLGVLAPPPGSVPDAGTAPGQPS